MIWILIIFLKYFNLDRNDVIKKKRKKQKGLTVNIIIYMCGLFRRKCFFLSLSLLLLFVVITITTCCYCHYNFSFLLNTRAYKNRHQMNDCDMNKTSFSLFFYEINFCTAYSYDYNPSNIYKRIILLDSKQDTKIIPIKNIIFI